MVSVNNFKILSNRQDRDVRNFLLSHETLECCELAKSSREDIEKFINENFLSVSSNLGYVWTLIDKEPNETEDYILNVPSVLYVDYSGDWHRFDIDDVETYPKIEKQVLAQTKDGKFHIIDIDYGVPAQVSTLSDEPFEDIPDERDFYNMEDVVAWHRLPKKYGVVDSNNEK